MPHPLPRLKRQPAAPIDFGDRETIPAELIPDIRLPEPEVTYLPHLEGWRRFIDAIDSLNRMAA